MRGKSSVCKTLRSLADSGGWPCKALRAAGITRSESHHGYLANRSMDRLSRFSTINDGVLFEQIHSFHPCGPHVARGGCSRVAISSPNTAEQMWGEK